MVHIQSCRSMDDRFEVFSVMKAMIRRHSQSAPLLASGHRSLVQRRTYTPPTAHEIDIYPGVPAGASRSARPPQLAPARGLPLLSH